METFNKVLEKLDKDAKNSKDSDFQKTIVLLFKKLSEYTERCIREVGENFLQTVFNKTKDEFYISQSIGYRNSITHSTGLYPMLKGKTIIKDILSHNCFALQPSLNFSNKNSLKLFDVYLNLSQKEINRLMTQNIIYSVELSDEKKSVIGKARLEQNNEYLNKEKELYSLFISNNIEWHTLNFPYSRKMFNLTLLYTEELSSLNKITKINIQDLNFPQKACIDCIPIWNLCIEIKKQPKISKIPNSSKEIHKYELGKIAEPILINLSNVEFTIQKDNKNTLSIIAQDIELPLEIWILKKIKDNEFAFPVFSNKIDVFSPLTYSCVKSKKVRTVGELHRVVNSLQNVKENKITLTSVKTDESSPVLYNDKNRLKNRNWVIENELSLKNRAVMNLYFNVEKKDPFSEDLIDFAVSEIQLMFPEYYCNGIIDEK